MKIVGPDFMTEDFDAEDEDAIDVAVQFEGDMQALDIASMRRDSLGATVDESTVDVE